MTPAPVSSRVSRRAPAAAVSCSSVPRKDAARICAGQWNLPDEVSLAALLALPGVIDELRTLVQVDLAAVEDAVEAQGGPWTPGRMPVFDGGE